MLGSKSKLYLFVYLTESLGTPTCFWVYAVLGYISSGEGAVVEVVDGAEGWWVVGLEL